jgi:hypothetical protein
MRASPCVSRRRRRDARAPHPRHVASPESESPALNHRAHAGETAGDEKRLSPNVNPPSQSLSRTAAPSVLRQNVTVTKRADRFLLTESAWDARLLMIRVHPIREKLRVITGKRESCPIRAIIRENMRLARRRRSATSPRPARNWRRHRLPMKPAPVAGCACLQRPGYVTVT